MRHRTVEHNYLSFYVAHLILITWICIYFPIIPLMNMSNVLSRSRSMQVAHWTWVGQTSLSQRQLVPMRTREQSAAVSLMRSLQSPLPVTQIQRANWGSRRRSQKSASYPSQKPCNSTEFPPMRRRSVDLGLKFLSVIRVKGGQL